MRRIEFSFVDHKLDHFKERKYCLLNSLTHKYTSFGMADLISHMCTDLL